MTRKSKSFVTGRTYSMFETRPLLPLSNIGVGVTTGTLDTTFAPALLTDTRT